MEEEIARLMLKMSKFEFYVVNRDRRMARTMEIRGLRVVAGINWSTLAQDLEAKHPFAKFDFAGSSFGIFKETAPQYLVMTDREGLDWDSDVMPIDSWDRLLTRSYGQLRNNIAHGNKAHLPAPFTFGRTAKFLPAGGGLIDFIAKEVFGDPGWEEPITYK